VVDIALAETRGEVVNDLGKLEGFEVAVTAVSWNQRVGVHGRRVLGAGVEVQVFFVDFVDGVDLVDVVDGVSLVHFVHNVHTVHKHP
jgi:hypothetical protein